MNICQTNICKLTTHGPDAVHPTFPDDVRVVTRMETPK